MSPEKGSLEAGEAACISLTAAVAGGPGGAAQAVCAEGRGRLDAVLVLRVAGGNDLFLALSGAYRPSCFGLSLATLTDLARRAAAPPRNTSALPQSTPPTAPGPLGRHHHLGPAHEATRRQPHGCA